MSGKDIKTASTVQKQQDLSQSFKTLTAFIPSLRKILFFQKKMRQFSEEFAFATVLVQNIAILVFSDVDFSAKVNAMKKNDGK